MPAVKFVANVEYPAKMDARQSEVVLFLADAYADAVRTEMLTSIPSGRMYGWHRASAPGQPPAPWSNELVDSIAASPGAGNGAVVSVSRKAGVYAPMLEFGTVNMLPRPIWRRSVETIRGKRLAIPPPGSAA